MIWAMLGFAGGLLTAACWFLWVYLKAYLK